MDTRNVHQTTAKYVKRILFKVIPLTLLIYYQISVYALIIAESKHDSTIQKIDYCVKDIKYKKKARREKNFVAKIRRTDDIKKSSIVKKFLMNDGRELTLSDVIMHEHKDNDNYVRRKYELVH